MGKPKKLQPVSAARLLSGIPSPPMLVEGLIPRGGLVMVASDPYVGKTWVGLEAGRAVASHTPFLGKFTAWGGRVLFVEEDEPDWALSKQVQQLMGHQNEGERLSLFQVIPENLSPQVITSLEKNLFFLVNQRVSLDTVEGAVMLGRATASVGSDPEDRGADLVVLDTLRSMHSGDENDATWMAFILGNLRLIQDMTGAAIMILHHHNKPTKENSGSLSYRVRGSTAILGALDGLIGLTKLNKDGLVRAQVLKSRAIQTDGFHFWILPSEQGGINLQYHEGKSDLVTKVRELIASKGEVGWEDLLAVGKAAYPFKQEPALRTSLNRVLSLLEGQEAITKKGRGRWSRIAR